MPTSMCLHIYGICLLPSRVVTMAQRTLFCTSRSISRSTAQLERRSKIGSSPCGSVHTQLPLPSTSINVSCTDQIVLSVIWGSILGFGFRHLMKFCERKDLIDRQSYVAQYVSLALLTVGTTSLIGSDDLLASFACGTAFAWDGFFNKQTEASVFSSVIDLLLNTAAFVFVGAWMPFDSFSDEALSLSVGRLICLAILVLLLRRLPIIVALFKWIPDIKSFREALFSGHFGPMGIGKPCSFAFAWHPIAHVTSQALSLHPRLPLRSSRGLKTRQPTRRNASPL